MQPHRRMTCDSHWMQDLQRTSIHWLMLMFNCQPVSECAIMCAKSVKVLRVMRMPCVRHKQHLCSTVQQETPMNSKLCTGLEHAARAVLTDYPKCAWPLLHSNLCWIGHGSAPVPGMLHNTRLLIYKALLHSQELMLIVAQPSVWLWLQSPPLMLACNLVM